MSSEAIQDASPDAPCDASPDVPVTPEMIEKAKKLASEMKNMDGFKDMQNLMLSMGLHAVRSTLCHMVKAADLTGAKKQSILKAIANISPITEVGCMHVNFYNNTTKKIDNAYMMLDECAPDHDLTAEFDKIKPHISSEKWVEITKSLGVLLYTARSVYGNIVRSNSILKNIWGNEADLTEFMDYKVDTANTTLYINESWPIRIGFRIVTDC